MAAASRYVQKYTRKPNTQVKDEFFISTDDVNQINQFKDKIEKMHQIEISFENKTEEGQWLILEGEPVDRRNAKSYITAMCNPLEKKQVQFAKSSCSELTDPTTLEYIEKTTNAFIRPLKKIAQFEISGTELAVTLALSQIEELAGTALVGKDQCNVEDDDHYEHDGMIMISPNTHNASSRLSTVLERALSANSDGICSAEDYRKVPQAVKRVLVNCLQDDDQDDIDDELLFADGTKESGDTDNFKRSNIMMFYEGDEKPIEVDEKTTVQTSPGISTIAEKVTELTVSNPNATTLLTKQQEYLRSFGMSVGFKEAEVDKALCFVHEKTRPSDFLDMLNSLQTQEENQEENDSDDDVIILETETVNLVTDERIVVDETLNVKDKGKISNESNTNDIRRLPKAPGQTSLPDGYKERLFQDFFTEDENCSVDELKKRNAERQKLLRQNFESQQKNDANNETTQEQTGKKQNKRGKNRGKKKKQQQQQQQQCVENKQEREGMHDKQFRLDTNENDKASKNDDQTCVLRVWSKDQGSTSASVGQSADEPFQTTPKRKGRNTQQQQQQPQLISGNNNNVRQRSPNPGFQKGTQWVEPVGRGKKPMQIVTPVNTTEGDFNKMAGQAQGGPVEEDLRYIVIDGSNVAMTHGNGKHFSCKGIKICVDYFRQRGHKNITVFVPQWRQYQPSDTNMILDQNILYELKQEDILVFTPSRKIGRKLVVAYDDRFVLELAEAEDGIIVSNDQYRDLMYEKAAWRKLIEERLLMYSFVRDRFMPPNDPLGREGPCLDDYLRVPKVTPFQRYRQGYNTPHQQQLQQQHHQNQHQNRSNQQQNQHYQPFQSQQNYQQQFPQAVGHGHIQQGQGQFNLGQGHIQQMQPPFLAGRGNFAKAVNQGLNYNENKQPFQKQAVGARNKTPVQKQFEGQHLNDPDNATQGTKQGKGQWKSTTQKGQWSLKGKGNPRTDEETEELFKELRIMFPDDDQEEKIRSVLANHDRERDLTKLTNYLMSVLF